MTWPEKQLPIPMSAALGVTAHKAALQPNGIKTTIILLKVRPALSTYERPNQHKKYVLVQSKTETKQITEQIITVEL